MKRESKNGSSQLFGWKAVWVLASVLCASFLLALIGGQSLIHASLEFARGFLANKYPIPLNEEEVQLIIRMIENGYILTPHEFIENLTGFYGSIIQYLMGLIAILGIVSFFYIRGISVREAERLAEEKVKEYFFKPEFGEHLNIFRSS